MSARSKARKRALDVLFEADQRGRDLGETLGEWVGRDDPPVPAYSIELVTGVAEHRARIDEVLTGYAGDWPLERMPSVDRSVLRLATYELLWSTDVPAAVRDVVRELEPLLRNHAVARDIFKAGELIGENGGQQVLRFHALQRRRDLMPAPLAWKGECASRIPAPTNGKHGRIEQRLDQEFANGFAVQIVKDLFQWKRVLRP